MSIRIDKITEQNDTLKFTISGVGVSIVNSLRRIILADIKSFIIRTSPYERNNVDFITNTTRLNNELIKQRLSCIPIHIDDMDFPYQQYELEIIKENDTFAPIIVTTEDFKVKNIASDTYLSKEETNKIFPPNSITGDYISIVRLRPKIMETAPGESLNIKCKLDIGTGREDGSFTAVGTCMFMNTVDQTKVASVWKEKEAAYKQDGVDEKTLKMYYNDFLHIDAKRQFIPNSFDFTVQTIGVHSNISLIKQACQIAIDSYNLFENYIQTGKLKINKSPTTMDNCFDIVLEEKDYTFGAVIEAFMFEKFYSTGVLTFCGFKKFHPHDLNSVLRLAFANAIEVENIQQYLLIACSEIKSIYSELKGLF